MKLCSPILLSSLLSACTIHLHVHEAPHPVEPASSNTAHAADDSWSHWEPTVSGVVRDLDGKPVRARVAAIIASGGGSVSSHSSDQGRFSLPVNRSDELVMNASTEDVRIAILPARPGPNEVQLVLHPGGTLALSLTGRPNARCAVFWNDLRIEDFTLHRSEPVKVVVPDGQLRVRMYDAKEVYDERSCEVGIGKTVALDFELHS